MSRPKEVRELSDAEIDACLARAYRILFTAAERVEAARDQAQPEPATDRAAGGCDD